MALSHDRIAVLLPLAVGTALTFCTIVIHAFAVTAIVHIIRREQRLGRAGAGFWRNLNIVVRITLLALAAHLVEAAAWALAFALCGQFPDLGSAFYHSVENYTTLGYGDVVMSPSWRLLGPLEAAAGMLMFGVSTAGIFAVIQLLIQARFADSDN
jgi:Ion channel